MGGQVMEGEKVGVMAALALGAVVGFVACKKLIERKFYQLPWYKRILLFIVHKLPG